MMIEGNMEIDKFLVCHVQEVWLDEINVTARLLKCPGFFRENNQIRRKDIYVWFGGCLMRKCSLYIITKQKNIFVFESVLTNVIL